MSLHLPPPLPAFIGTGIVIIVVVIAAATTTTTTTTPPYPITADGFKERGGMFHPFLAHFLLALQYRPCAGEGVLL